MNVKILRKLFVNRDDVYAVQMDDGTYTKVEAALTDRLLKDHLQGKKTIGVYQLNRDNKVIGACLDIDINKNIWSNLKFKYDDWKPKVEEQIDNIKEKLRQRDITGYVENSGFKGAHVWLFFEQPVAAKTVRDMMDTIFKNLKLVDENNIHIEFFPKQITLGKDGFGNLIKVPLGLHQKSGKFSYFEDDISGDIKYVNQDLIDRVNSPIDSIFIGCEVMDSIRKQAPAGHLGHFQRLALALTLIPVPGGEEELRRLIKMQDDYDEGITNYQIDNIRTNGYNAVSCEKLQSTGFEKMCPGPCANIGKGKFPIDFYFRHKGQSASQDNFEFTSDLDKYEENNNQFFVETSKGREKYEMLSNFSLKFDTIVTRDDGIDLKTELQGKIVTPGGKPLSFEISATDYSQPDKLKAAVYNRMGSQNVFCKNWTQLQTAINKFTVASEVYIKEIFGYEEDDKGQPYRYLSPSYMVNTDGIWPNKNIRVDLSKKDAARYLDLNHIDNDNEFENLKEHIEEKLFKLAEFGIIHSIIGHTFLPIIDPWLFSDDHTRYTLFIKGTTGAGKSFILQCFQHFYGLNFKKIINWTSTPNAIVEEGFYFKDVFYLVDDWKKDNVKDEPGAKALLQNYADRSARSRLDSNANIKETKPIRGILGIAGEDFVDNSSSVVARMINLLYEQKIKEMKKGYEVLSMRHLYGAVTSRYIHYILTYPKKEEIKEYYETTVFRYYNIVAGLHNDSRIARNFALLQTSYHFFSQFFWDNKTAKANEKKLEEYLREAIDLQLRLSAAYRPAERFWTGFKNLLTIGKIRLQANNQIDDGKPRGSTVVGFNGATNIYVLMDVAVREVEKALRSAGASLSFSQASIVDDLFRSGILDKPTAEKQSMNGRMELLYKLTPNAIDETTV
ncbi:MAG: TOTE conflict system archaeo-eukaryotic primase domain-containing protein [Candidatus Hodarchaeales archaeon]|jgi:hypothetical protein